MPGLVSHDGDLPAIPDALRQKLRYRLESLPVKRLESPNDWAALVVSERWRALGAARKHGLGRGQRAAVAALHSSETNQRIVSARPDIAARHAEGPAFSHPLAYEVATWFGNQRMWAKALWFRFRYR
jgi:hypothetical protein